MQSTRPSPEDILQGARYLLAQRIWESVPGHLLGQLMEQKGEVCLYAKGERIWSDAADYRRALGLVLDGTAQVMKERMLLSVHRQGDYFGLVTLYAPVGYYATEIAALTPCRVLFLGRDAVDGILRAYPQAALQLIAYLSERVYYLNARLDTVIAGSAARRLECHLRAGAVMDGEGRLVCPVPSRTALAKTLGMGRASLYRALDELTRQGLIEKEGNDIVLKSVVLHNN